eukprot:Phypoly_transcript_13278.p1 GENE.Phypoly_transcript_13278~~Phypoly_transcript_13278.p1  ORF type:complete len:326 (+),score=55.02 Phypoly_transcript_13278:39-980(+)
MEKGEGEAEGEERERNCGHCSHKKHHGIRCYTQVNNPNYSTCTCEHSHHKGRQCGATIHYNEYRTEQKMARVAKQRTLYRTETQQVSVVKQRMKQVDQGRWVQRPYGPGNGTHAVYEPRMVSVPETYTEYETKQVQVPYQETYYVDEMQTVQIPVPKTRPCTCMGNDCRCSTCVPKVPCGCNKCDCAVCAALSEKESILTKKKVIWGSIFGTIAFLGILGSVFSLAMGLNESFGIAVANTFNKPDWIYNMAPVAETALIICWISFGVTLISVILAVILVTCGDSIFTVTPPAPRIVEEEPEPEENREEEQLLI